MELVSIDLGTLTIRRYPDPCLRKVCEPITEFDDDLKAFARRMFELMREGRGVGLAAPQVGVLKRLFVMNHTGEEQDGRVFVNPEIRDLRGSQEGEEGCLCLPDVYVKVRRAAACTIRAQDLDGNPFEIEADALFGRVCQHETDHLNGVLILDRMGPSDRIATKKRLKELEAEYQAKTGRK